MCAAKDWASALERWFEPFLTRFETAAARHWAPVYAKGLLLPGERKSVQPMAERVAPGDFEQLHHFVATSPWAVGPLEEELARHADRLVGGPDAVLVVDDTALLKKGRMSVGVAQQYAGCVGKNANCQVMVSLTLARREVPVPIALRLFLPDAWFDDEARLARAAVPAERTAEGAPRTKSEIALAEIDRLRKAGVRFGTVLGDAGYGSAEFRGGLSARTLLWALGIAKTNVVYPADVGMVERGPTPRGRPRKPVPAQAAIAVETMLGAAEWRRIGWRRGTKGELRADFAAARVRPADGAHVRDGEKVLPLPGDEMWLVGERRASGERKYYLSNLPADAALETLAALVKSRWVCEQAHQQMKEELGLDHFEGRKWHGLHHHALMTMISFAFLQHLRLLEADGGGEKKRRRATRGGSAAAADATGSAPAPHRPA
jgi:SRSO17 transposase